MSVRTGLTCVSIIQYYYHSVKRLSSGRHGIALRLSEWIALKDAIQQVHLKYPALSTVQPCSTQFNHQNLEGALSCSECQPFGYSDSMIGRRKNYRAARKGPRIQLAVDRHRFKHRVQQTLANIFTDSHRDKMWFYVNNNKSCV